jgi:Cu-Zn family superoxide dismutase
VNQQEEQAMRRALKVMSVGALVMTAVVMCLVARSDAGPIVARTTLVDNAGNKVGRARFHVRPDGSLKGRIIVTLPTDSPGFHGLHLHANADSTGCQPGTGFTGVGGHWDVGGHTHGEHTGDLPSLKRQNDGEAEVVVVVDQYLAADILGRAVIVHAGPDNFGNVPLGTAANQYTDNGTAYSGTGGTAATGNAGARFACGVLVP